jgi:hypothetical protein
LRNVLVNTKDLSVRELLPPLLFQRHITVNDLNLEDLSFARLTIIIDEAEVLSSWNTADAELHALRGEDAEDYIVVNDNYTLCTALGLVRKRNSDILPLYLYAGIKKDRETARKRRMDDEDTAPKRRKKTVKDVYKKRARRAWT